MANLFLIQLINRHVHGHGHVHVHPFHLYEHDHVREHVSEHAIPSEPLSHLLR